MKLVQIRFAAVLVLLCTGALLLAQTRPSSSADGVEIARGFKVRPNGVVDIADVFAEVNYYSSNWTISQQHDRFAPDKPMAGDGARSVEGILTTAGGSAKYSEKITPVDGGIDYSATFSSDKPLTTNEISMAFLLPTKSFAGKEIQIDQQPLKLATDAAPKGQPRLFEKPEAHEVVLPTASGTLTIKGNFRFMIQDDREWNDARYSMRLFFTPGSGDIAQSKIELQMRLAQNK